VKRETPAVTAVTRKAGGGTQTIYSCQEHVMRTVRELGGKDLALTPADQSVHGCKGCQEDWTP
jgi:hypothetical protein